MVKLQAPKVGLELAHLGAVGVHQVLPDVVGLVDLVDNDLGVIVGDQSLDSQGNNNAQPVDQGLVLDAVVGRFVVDLQDILQMIALGRNEEDACSCSFEVQGNVEVHFPVFRILRRRGLLGLCPLKDEVGEDLGLYGLSRVELKVESPNSIDHLTMRLTVSRLCKISLRGELETTLTLCDWK
jgi:hypothetical protein